MSLRQLVDGECGGVNPLMQLGAQFTRDTAHKDDGLMRREFERTLRPEDEMVSEFLGHVAAPPQSFQMDALLQEMNEIEAKNMTPLHRAPSTMNEVAGQWTKDFSMQNQIQMLPPSTEVVNVQPKQQQIQHVSEFFDDINPRADHMTMTQAPFFYQPMQPLYTPIGPTPEVVSDSFFEEASNIAAHDQAAKNLQDEAMEDWVNDYETSKEENERTASNYNEKFWHRLQEEWSKLAEEPDHDWLSEYSDSYDPYKEYQFAEENPMSELDNALEKGKEYLSKGDIPSAVLCFEIAAQKDPNNAEIWEILGMTQAENEMDPQSIAALKKALELQPDNRRVLMALSICYTNESLPNQAVKMLSQWLAVHPKYKFLVEKNSNPEEDISLISSLVQGNKLTNLQELYLQAVRSNPNEVDAEVQEALGVLFNLSSEYDKAVDCFKAALSINPTNAKVWNRLGASLANGSRSVEAVDAYQNALQLEPGFIRVRYNVGVCCMNLKAYKQAVDHLLTALNMQSNTAAQRDFPSIAGAVGGSSHMMSESIWTTLKMVISLMGRTDLQGFVKDRDLKALNEAFKDLSDIVG